MMDQNIEDREEKIYDEIMKLKEGNESDRSLAFECSGILGNELTLEPFESRLEIVEEMINDYLNK